MSNDPIHMSVKCVVICPRSEMIVPFVPRSSDPPKVRGGREDWLTCARWLLGVHLAGDDDALCFCREAEEGALAKLVSGAPVSPCARVWSVRGKQEGGSKLCLGGKTDAKRRGRRRK